MLSKNINECSNVFQLFKDCWPILTAGGKDYNSMTISWGQMGVLWNKNVAIVYVRPQRHTYEFIQSQESFTLSFLPETYKEELAYFGSKSGKDVDKFKETGLTPVYDVDFDVTYVKEATFVLKMKKLYVDQLKKEGFLTENLLQHYPIDDFHYVFIGEVKQYLVNEEAHD